MGGTLEMICLPYFNSASSLHSVTPPDPSCDWPGVGWRNIGGEREEVTVIKA